MSINTATKRPKTSYVEETVYAMAHALTNKHLGLRDYTQLCGTIHCQYEMEDNILKDTLIVTVLTQYHILNDIKVFGDLGVEAVMQELKQLHEMMVVDPKKLRR